MAELIAALNTITPLGVIALLGFVIYELVQRRRNPSNRDLDARIATMISNHLHELPEMAATLRRMESALDRIATAQADTGKELAYIRARINGK